MVLIFDLCKQNVSVSSAGFDEFSANMFNQNIGKSLAENWQRRPSSLGQPQSIICTSSFSGYFFKLAEVFLIYKSKDILTTDTINCRPMSQLSAFKKYLIVIVTIIVVCDCQYSKLRFHEG